MVRLAHMTHLSTSSLNPFAVNTSAKDAFARLLATENLTVVHDSTAPTAMFDTMSRVLTLPVWKDMTGDIYDMLCAHEVGHALHTPRDMSVVAASMAAIDADPSVNQQVLHDYLNVVEDIRIDRLMKDLYPGLKRCYAEAGKYLYNKNFFGVTDLSPADVASLSMLDRINLHFKSGIYGVTSVPMSVDEAAWLPRLESMKTWDDVVALATELYEYDGARKAGKQNKQQQNPQPGSNASKGDGAAVAGEDAGDAGDAGESEATGEASESQDTSSANDPSNSSGPEAQTQNGNKQGGTASKQDKKEPAPAKAPTAAASGGGSGCKPSGSVTAAAERQNASSLVAADGTIVRKWKMPTVDLKAVVVDYKSCAAQFAAHISRNCPLYTGNKLLADFRKNSSDAIKMLVKQFEMKMAADESRRSRSARCGVIDMDRVSDYRFSDDIFLTIEEHAKGKNHGMMIFVDWSGSMSGNLHNTVYQLMNLVLFCKAVSIPFEVYLFTDAYDAAAAEYNLTGKGVSNGTYTHVKVCNEYTEEVCPRTGHKNTQFGDYLQFRRFHLLNVLSSKMTKTQFDLCAAMVLAFGDSRASSYHNYNPTPYGFTLGGTPLDEAVYASVQLTQQFKADNKLQVVNVCFLTDGESGSCPFSTNDVRGNNNARPVLVDGNKSWAVPVKVSAPRYGNAYVSEKMTTTAVIRSYLKYKTGANVIGFFLTDTVRTAEHYLGAQSELEAQASKISLKENGFASVTTEGFDQNFIIVPTATTSSDDVKKALKKASSTTVASAFMKSSKSIRGSRVLMSRIADVIAKNLS